MVTLRNRETSLWASEETEIDTKLTEKAFVFEKKRDFSCITTVPHAE